MHNAGMARVHGSNWHHGSVPGCSTSAARPFNVNSAKMQRTHTDIDTNTVTRVSLVSLLRNNAIFFV